MTSVQVKTASGSGFLSHHDGWVLFVPDSDDVADGARNLIDAFVHSGPEVVRDAIAAAVVEGGFEVPAFALIGVTAEAIHLRVFGDLEIVSTLTTAPMISGRGSDTWVDHSSPSQRGVTVSCGAKVDERTCLGHGSVLAGGVSLIVSDRDTAVETAIKQAPNQAVPSSETLPPASWKPLRSESNDQILDESASGMADEPSEVVRSEFTLEFDDGQDVSVDGPLVIGRKPLVDDVQDRAVPVTGERVSRTHLRVEVVDGALHVTDLDSHNGSAVISAATGVPEELPAATAVRVGEADRVVIGAQAFTVRVAGAPDA